jgi:hypothetical protein
MGPGTTAPPRWFRIVAWLAVAWMLIGVAAALPFPLLILAIGIALLALARHATQRGWIPAVRPEAGVVAAPGA